MTSIGSPRGPSGRRRTLVAAAAGFVVLVLGAAIYVSGASQDRAATATPPHGAGIADGSPRTDADTGDGYLIGVEALRRRADIARDGLEPYRGAMEALVAEADRALDREPRPRNPLSARKGQFLTDTQDAYTLALAWVTSGAERYALKSAKFIMAWVEQVDETGETCPDRGGNNCATSLLVSRTAPGFVFAADLLEGSGALSADDEAQLKAWLAEVILPTASQRTNNWGDAGIFMRLAVTDYIGDDAAFDSAVESWRALMDLVTAEGQIPEETRRGSLGLLYTQGAISFKVAAAVIAKRRGVDLWSYEGTNGGTLRQAVDTLAHFWEDPESWPWHEGRLEIPSVDPVWELIYHRWPEPAFARIFAEKRPFGTANPSAVVWTTLTHGEPFDERPASIGPGNSRESLH